MGLYDLHLLCVVCYRHLNNPFKKCDGSVGNWYNDCNVISKPANEITTKNFGMENVKYRKTIWKSTKAKLQKCASLYCMIAAIVLANSQLYDHLCQFVTA